MTTIALHTQVPVPVAEAHSERLPWRRGLLHGCVDVELTPAATFASELTVRVPRCGFAQRLLPTSWRMRLAGDVAREYAEHLVA